MGDWSSGGKLSRYITSHPRQLSLAIPLWVGAISTNLGLEGNRRSGVALAMRHSGVSTYGLNGLWKGDEHPTYAPSEYALLYLYLYLYHRLVGGGVTFSGCLSVRPSVRLFVRLLPNFYTRCFENDWTDFDANWPKWCTKRSTLEVMSQRSKVTRGRR